MLFAKKIVVSGDLSTGKTTTICAGIAAYFLSKNNNNVEDTIFNNPLPDYDSNTSEPSPDNALRSSHSWN
uniref:Dethiobiotin synthase n=1 Tax=Strongyloides stercoralis TaxID=6248 RepID=A0A0K0E596_STRER